MFYEYNFIRILFTSDIWMMSLQPMTVPAILQYVHKRGKRTNTMTNRNVRIDFQLQPFLYT